MPINIPSPFRTLLWVLLGICALLLIISYLRDPASLPVPPHKPGGPDQTASGKVVRYGSNSGGDIDKVALDIGHDSVWFHFPPHAARTITAMAGVHSFVSVLYRKRDKHGAAGDKELISIKPAASDRGISIPEMPPPPPRPGKSITVSGGKDELRLPSAGQARFFILSGKRIVLSPRSGETLFPLLRSGSNIMVTGDQRADDDGFMSLDGLPMIRAKVIRIDSISYLIE